MVGTITAYEGVETFHPVDQTLLDEKIQSAVDSGRFGRPFEGFYSVEQIVGFDGTMAFPDQFQNFAAQWSEICSSSTADLLGHVDGPVYAVSVVMLAGGGIQWVGHVAIYIKFCDVII